MTRSELLAFQLVQNEGYEEAKRLIDIRIEFQAQVISVNQSLKELSYAKFLTDTKEEIEKLKPQKP